MPDYDFHQLSPYDLEILARDLLQAHWDVTIESFKTGKDRGIDLRYAAGSNQTIVQVKHLLRTGLAGLLRELKKEAVNEAFSHSASVGQNYRCYCHERCIGRTAKDLRYG